MHVPRGLWTSPRRAAAAASVAATMVCSSPRVNSSSPRVRVSPRVTERRGVFMGARGNAADSQGSEYSDGGPDSSDDESDASDGPSDGPIRRIDVGVTDDGPVNKGAKVHHSAAKKTAAFAGRITAAAAAGRASLSSAAAAPARDVAHKTKAKRAPRPKSCRR